MSCVPQIQPVREVPNEYLATPVAHANLQLTEHDVPDAARGGERRRANCVRDAIGRVGDRWHDQLRQKRVEDATAGFRMDFDGVTISGQKQRLPNRHLT